MNRSKLASHQAGFEHAGIILAVLVIAVIGFAGWRVWQYSNDAAKPTTATTATTPSTTVPESINTKVELDQAGNVLNASSTELDSNLNSSSLDADISSIL